MKGMDAVYKIECAQLAYYFRISSIANDVSDLILKTFSFHVLSTNTNHVARDLEGSNLNAWIAPSDQCRLYPRPRPNIQVVSRDAERLHLPQEGPKPRSRSLRNLSVSSRALQSRYGAIAMGLRFSSEH